MQERRLAAIMFTDIVGYTSLMGSDEDRAFEVLRKNREIHKQLIEKFNGSLIKEMGDGMLISFHLASDAVRCAIELQEACKAQNIPLKIGIHEGEMVFEGADVLGDGVNVASRLQDNSQEGRIQISGNVYDAVKNKAEITARFLGNRKFKNISETIKVYEVLSEEEYNLSRKKVDQTKTKYVYYILGSFIALVIVALGLWQFLPDKHSSGLISKEKSIAVMPFDNESSDEDNEYFVNGMMEDIRNNLSKIGDLRVTSKTSTEKYRYSNLSIPEIAKELNVNFILEGTVTKIGNKVRIHAQLIDAETDDHIWVDTYNRDLDDVFRVQSEIAQIIATELYSTITPEEKRLLETPLTKNITAYEIFNRARHYQEAYWMEGSSTLGLGIMTTRSHNMEDLDKAIQLYRNVLEIDSTFSKAYTGLAMALGSKYWGTTYGNEYITDTVLFLANKALSFNDQVEEAYLLRGIYYRYVGSRFVEAIDNLDKAIKINPNYATAYLEIGSIYIWDIINYIEGIKHLFKAYELDKSYLLPSTMNSLSYGYLGSGFYQEAEYFANELFKLRNDTVRFYNSLAFLEWCKGDIQKGIYWGFKAYELDTLYTQSISFLTFRYSYIGDIKNANRFLQKYLEMTQSEDRNYINLNHRIGYILYEQGKTREAMEFFNQEIANSLNEIEIHDTSSSRGFSYYDLFAIYAFLNEYDKAFEYLEKLDEEDFYPSWLMSYFKYDPLLGKIREDQRFVEFLKNAEIKFNTEHDRVQTWLENEGIL